jgi:hypothetical protein
MNVVGEQAIHWRLRNLGYVCCCDYVSYGLIVLMFWICKIKQLKQNTVVAEHEGLT